MKKISLVLICLMFSTIGFAESFKYNIFTDCTDVTSWFFRDTDKKRCEVKLENICKKELAGELADVTFASKQGFDYILGVCTTSEEVKLKAGSAINMYNFWLSNIDVDFYNHYRFSAHEKTKEEKERAEQIDINSNQNTLQLSLACQSLGGDIKEKLFDAKNTDNIYVLGKCQN